MISLSGRAGNRTAAQPARFAGPRRERLRAARSDAWSSGGDPSAPPHSRSLSEPAASRSLSEDARSAPETQRISPHGSHHVRSSIEHRRRRRERGSRAHAARGSARRRCGRRGRWGRPRLGCAPGEPWGRCAPAPHAATHDRTVAPSSDHCSSCIWGARGGYHPRRHVTVTRRSSPWPRSADATRGCGRPDCDGGSGSRRGRSPLPCPGGAGRGSSRSRTPPPRHPRT